jgi:hypothetical protein
LANSSTNWDIGLSAWIIQDGTYPDFEVGQTVEFALEFWIPEGSADRATTGLYDTVAEVIVENDKIAVIDIGVLAYQHASPKPLFLRKEPRVAIQLKLCVDAVGCFETQSKNGDVLPLVYSWKIISILKQTAPFIETIAEGRKVRIRDQQRLGYEEILKTDAWNDDGGHAEYMLRCDLLPIPPKHKSATARP